MRALHPQHRARLLTSVVSLATALCLVGCATERLAAAAPKGVDLTGEWQLNNNLSDDPTKGLGEERGRSPNGGMRRRGGRGGGGGGGMPPFGMPGGAGGRSGSVPGSDDFRSSAPNTGASAPGGGSTGRDGFMGVRFAPAIERIGPDGASGPGGGGPSAGGGGRRRGGGVGQLLYAADHLAIDQTGDKMTIQRKGSGGQLTTDEYTFGDKSSVTLGQATAERTTGWKGNVFVIETKAKGGPAKEEDFALDDEGHLIVTTFLSGSRVPKVEIKRVYDRVRAK